MDRVGFLTCLSVFKNACQVLEYKFYLWRLLFTQTYIVCIPCDNIACQKNKLLSHNICCTIKTGAFFCSYFHHIFFNYCWTSVITVVKHSCDKIFFFIFLIKFMPQMLYIHKCTKMFIKYW